MINYILSFIFVFLLSVSAIAAEPYHYTIRAISITDLNGTETLTYDDFPEIAEGSGSNGGNIPAEGWEGKGSFSGMFGYRASLFYKTLDDGEVEYAIWWPEYAHDQPTTRNLANTRYITKHMKWTAYKELTATQETRVWDFVENDGQAYKGAFTIKAMYPSTVFVVCQEGTHPLDSVKSLTVSTNLSAYGTYVGYTKLSGRTLSRVRCTDVSGCSYSVKTGTDVSVYAIPYHEPGYYELAWSGGCTGSTNPCKVEMDVAKTVTATWTCIREGGCE